MLLYPPVAELAEKTGSRYQLVNVVAQRARQISSEFEDNGEPLDEKPVSIAIQEVYAGKISVNHNPSAENAENKAERPEAWEETGPAAEPDLL